MVLNLQLEVHCLAKHYHSDQMQSSSETQVAVIVETYSVNPRTTAVAICFFLS